MRHKFSWRRTSASQRAAEARLCGLATVKAKHKVVKGRWLHHRLDAMQPSVQDGAAATLSKGKAAASVTH